MCPITPAAWTILLIIDQYLMNFNAAFTVLCDIFVFFASQSSTFARLFHVAKQSALLSLALDDSW